MEKDKAVELTMGKKIAEYLARSLPPREVRIPEPMNPVCEVCVIIPAYGERECILWPLESLARQLEVTADQFEVIIVVNNRDCPIAKEPGQTEAVYEEKLENHNKILENNRDTLKLIKHIQGQEDYSNLTREEEKAIAAIRQFGLQVFAVDKSAKGKTLPEPDANVGGARNRGVAEAVERFYKLGRNGILAHTDADTRVDEYYIRNLIRAFKKNPRLTGLAGFDEDTLVDPRDSEMMKDLLVGYAVSIYGAMMVHLFLPRDVAPSIYFVGSAMASRAFETAITGGIARVTGGEDHCLAQQMEEIGEVVWDKDVVTFPAVRYSPRTTTGKGMFMTQCTANEIEGRDIKVRSIEAAYYLFDIYSKLQEARKMKPNSPADLHKILIFENKPILDNRDLNRLNQNLQQLNSYMVDLLNEDLKELIRKICDRIDEKFQPIPISKAIPLLMKMYFTKDVIKKKFHALRAEIIQKRNQDLATIEYILDKIFQSEQQLHDIDRLAKITASILDNNKTQLPVNFFKKRHRIKRVAEIITHSQSKADALELIKVNFMEYLILPGFPEPGPVLSAYFELLVLEKTIGALNSKLS